MSEKTEAWYELRRQYVNDPPWRGDERRIERAMSMVPTRGQINFAMLGSPVVGRTCAGEVGLSAPNATTRHFEDDSVLIVFNSGLFEFLDAVVNTFMSAAQVSSNDGHEPTALPPNSVDERLLALYNSWPELWKNEEYRYQPVALGEGAEGIAKRLVDAAVLFLLFHEYGHAVLHAQVPLADRQPEHELEADRWGFDAMVRCFGSPTGQYRIALMGAIIAIRAWSALEEIGHRFPSTYPPPSVRYDTIMQMFRERCENAFDFYYLSTIAIAHDQRMDAAERAFKGLEYKPPVTTQAVLSTAMALLIETHAKRVEPDLVRETLAEMFLRADDDIARDAVETARAVFNAGAPAYGESLGRGDETTFIVDNFWSTVRTLDLKFSADKPPGVH